MYKYKYKKTRKVQWKEKILYEVFFSLIKGVWSSLHIKTKYKNCTETNVQNDK